MTTDLKGLGYAELGFLALNIPSIFDVVSGLIDAGMGADGLALARKAIAVYNAGLIGGTL